MDNKDFIKLSDYMIIKNPEIEVEKIKESVINGCPISISDSYDESLQFMRNLTKRILSSLMKSGVFNNEFYKQNVINRIDVMVNNDGLYFYFRF